MKYDTILLAQNTSHDELLTSDAGYIIKIILLDLKLLKAGGLPDHATAGDHSERIEANP